MIITKEPPVPSRPVNSIVATTVSTKKRSAIASSSAPQRDVAFTRRASQPSRKSVNAAAPMMPTCISVALDATNPAASATREKERRLGILPSVRRGVIAVNDTPPSRTRAPARCLSRARSRSSLAVTLEHGGDVNDVRAL